MRTPDGNLWGYSQHVYPGEDSWYDEKPLFPVEGLTVSCTHYTQPGGEQLDRDMLSRSR